MAIALGSGTQTATQPNSGTQSATKAVNAPTGATTSDFILLVIGGWVGANATYTVPTGFALLTRLNDPSSNFDLGIYWKVYASESSYSVTYNAGSGGQAQFVLQCGRLTGALTTGTVNDGSGGTHGAANTNDTGTLSAFSTTADGDGILCVCIQGSGAAGSSTPTFNTPTTPSLSGWTKVADASVDPTNTDVAVTSFFTIQTTHGSTGTFDSKLSTTPSGGFTEGIAAVAIEAAGGGTSVSNSDSGALAEGAPTIGLAASDSAADAESARVGVAGTEAAGLAESAAIGVSGQDTAAAAEQASVAAAVPAADSGALADAASVSAQLTASDAGTLGESAQAANAAGAAEAATGADSASVAASAHASDTGTLGEGAAVAAQIVAGDAATLADTASTPGGGNPTGGDAGGAGDTASVAATLLAADAAALADAAAVAAQIGRQDTGALAEAVRIGTAATDATVAADAAAVAATGPSADAGAGLDQAAVSAQVAVADAGALADAAGAAPNNAHPASESGTAGESAAVQVVSLAHPLVAAGRGAVLGAARAAIVAAGRGLPFTPGGR